MLDSVTERDSVLRPEDVRSATWRRLSRRISAQIDELRQQNDSVTIDALKTAWIRGQIEALKGILALADEASASATVTPGELAGGDIDE